MAQLIKTITIISYFWLAACTTVNVDHIKIEEDLTLSQGDAVVILGRRHSADSGTEATLIACIGNKIENKVKGKQINVIPEQKFVDEFYPWFEPRTSPLHPNKLKTTLDQPMLANKLNMLNIRYVIWVEGLTEKTNSAGGIGCAVGPGGGGCFGFGTWEDTSDYETMIWDLKKFREVGRISTDAVGTSYMPAFIVPIPMLAQVEGDACDGIGKQLLDFFVEKKR